MCWLYSDFNTLWMAASVVVILASIVIKAVITISGLGWFHLWVPDMSLLGLQV